MRNRFILPVLALLSLSAAPLAAQQTPRPPAMLQYSGDPVPYRIDLPRGWERRNEEDGAIAVVHGGKVMLLAGATDLHEERKHSLSLPEAEARRLLTHMVMDSDSVLFSMATLMSSGFVQRSGGTLRDVVREVRTLGGQRAGYLSAKLQSPGGTPVQMEVYFTIQDGVMYMVMMMAEKGSTARYAPVFAAMRESLVLPGPVSGWPAPAVTQAARP